MRTVLAGPAEAGSEVNVISPGEAGRSGTGSSPKRDSVHGRIVNLIVIIYYVIPYLERACCSRLVEEYLARDL